MVWTGPSVRKNGEKELLKLKDPPGFYLSWPTDSNVNKAHIPEGKRRAQFHTHLFGFTWNKYVNIFKKKMNIYAWMWEDIQGLYLV